VCVSELRLCIGKEKRGREWGGGEGGFYRLSRREEGRGVGGFFDERGRGLSA
jgi:hypothetical protein